MQSKPLSILREHVIADMLVTTPKQEIVVIACLEVVSQYVRSCNAAIDADEKATLKAETDARNAEALATSDALAAFEAKAKADAEAYALADAEAEAEAKAKAKAEVKAEAKAKADAIVTKVKQKTKRNSRPRKLTKVDIPVIRALYKEGNTYISIGKKYGVSQSCIHAVVSRNTWANVD